MGNSLPTKHVHSNHHSNKNEYHHQFLLLVGGPSVVIFQGLIDQIIQHQQTLSEYCLSINNNYKKFCKDEEQLLNDELIFIYDRLQKQFPNNFHESKKQRMSLKEILLDAWREPLFRGQYFEHRFVVDPYLVLPNLLETLRRGIKFNVKRECLFEPATYQPYLTYGYSTKTDNYPYKSNEQLSFEFFANCFMCDTWADVVVLSLCLSDYDNQEKLESYYHECERLSKFTCYRIVLIFTHPDVFQEKVKSRVQYQGKTDPNIRKELNHLRKDCALIINTLITNTLTVMKNNQDNSYPNRTYEYHIVNTSSDLDMKELLNCLAIGANVNRKSFITQRFNLPPFVIPDESCKQYMHRALKLGQLSDIILDVSESKETSHED